MIPQLSGSSRSIPSPAAKCSIESTLATTWSRPSITHHRSRSSAWRVGLGRPLTVLCRASRTPSTRGHSSRIVAICQIRSAARSGGRSTRSTIVPMAASRGSASRRRAHAGSPRAGSRDCQDRQFSSCSTSAARIPWVASSSPCDGAAASTAGVVGRCPQATIPRTAATTSKITATRGTAASPPRPAAANSVASP